MTRAEGLTLYAKVDFNENQIGESQKITITQDSTPEFNLTASFNVNHNDAAMLDDIAYKPVISECFYYNASFSALVHSFIRSLFIHIVTLNEVMPKEKKQKDEKIQMFGQSTLDLLPILKGNVSVSHLLPVFFTPGSSYELQPPENAQVFIHFISKSHLFVKCINAL